MAERRTVLKWWWGWNVERIERWLESREAEGWNLARVSSTGLLFTFVKGEPRRVAYRVDYQTRVDDDYLQLFEDAGWSLTGKGTGWYYWRCEYGAEKPEIYTDLESLIDRNRRQMRLVGIILAVQVAVMNIVFSHAHGPLTAGLAVIHFSVTALLAFALFKFVQANRRLKNQL